MKTLILGLGNPILSDDSVGFRVVQALMGRFDEQEVTVMESDLSGLSLLDLLVGYDRVIIVDSIQTVAGKVGQIYRLKPEDFVTPRHTGSTHDVSFIATLELGKRLGLEMPKEIVIFAIEVQDVINFGEKCTPEVERVIPKVVEMVAEEVENR